MRISDWSSDVCSSVLPFDSCIREFEANAGGRTGRGVSSQMIQPIAFLDDLVECRCIGVRTCNECVQTAQLLRPFQRENIILNRQHGGRVDGFALENTFNERSEEHKSELQSLMSISYAVLCLKKKKTNTN